jgi:hypothetical protein
MGWTLPAKDGATGQLPYDPLRCTCTHTSVLHALAETGGRRGACSASVCDCRRFEPSHETTTGSNR